jgi:hypothetical protein
MTVVSFSGDVSTQSIGLIACSRHQSGSYLPGAQHKPKVDFIVPVNGGPAVDYLRKNLGYEATRYSRTYYKFWDSEQWTGHTALFARINGQAAFAQGWVPQASVSNYFTSLVMGGESPGEWQNDLPMIDDPTCISIEFPVDRLAAEGLVQYWAETARGNFTTYSYETLGPGRCNCAWAAKTILSDYAAQAGLADIVSAMQKIASPTQGKLMGQIMGGELLMN